MQSGRRKGEKAVFAKIGIGEREFFSVLRLTWIQRVTMFFISKFTFPVEVSGLSIPFLYYFAKTADVNSLPPSVHYLEGWGAFFFRAIVGRVERVLTGIPEPSGPFS